MRKFVLNILLLIALFIFNSYTFAVDLTVEAPQEVLTQGQVFDFKIYIDTKGKPITKQSMIFTFDKNYIDFAGGVEVGDFFEEVSFMPPESGKMLLVASNKEAKSGTGLVATIKMKITATSAGSAQLCAVSPLDTTPTVGPTGTKTPTPQKYATNTPPPPKTGSVEQVIGASAVGGMLLLFSFIYLLII